MRGALLGLLLAGTALAGCGDVSAKTFAGAVASADYEKNRPAGPLGGE